MVVVQYSENGYTTWDIVRQTILIAILCIIYVMNKLILTVAKIEGEDLTKFDMHKNYQNQAQQNYCN